MLFSRDVAPSQSRIGRCGSCRAGARRHIAERRLVLGSRIPAATQGGCNGGGGGCQGGRPPPRLWVQRPTTPPPKVRQALAKGRVCADMLVMGGGALIKTKK